MGAPSSTAAAWHSSPKPSPPPVEPDRGNPLWKRAYPLLERIAADQESTAGEWFEIAHYDKPPTASNAKASLQRSTVKDRRFADIKIMKHLRWQFAARDGRLLVRLEPIG